MTKTDRKLIPYAVTIIYLVGVLLIAFTAARIGLSYYYGVNQRGVISDRDLARAIYFDPSNPEVYKNQAVRALANGDYSAAAAKLQHATELCPNDYLLWLNVGRVLTKSGDLDGARNAYQTAIALAPNYAQPNRYMGLMLLNGRTRDEAFIYLRKAAERDTSLYPEILQVATEQFPDDPVAIEQAVRPQTLEARKLVARFILEHDLISDSVRSLITSEELTDAEKDPFIQILISRDKVQLAHETWLTKKGIAASPKPSDAAPVFDGGFEVIISSDTSGFGWQINSDLSNTAISVDSKMFHTGARSLSIKFAGHVEPGAYMISQMVFVKPFQHYRLSFFVSSADLVSGGLPVMVVEAGKPMSRLATSPVIKATNGNWVEMTLDFKAQAESIVRFGLQRANCDTSPCPIFGSLSLDDFSIREVD